MKSVQNILDLSDDLSEKLQKSTCSSIIGSHFAVPFRVACELVIMIAAKIVFAIKLAYQIARDGVAIAEVIEGHKTQNHARNNYEVCFICYRLEPGNLRRSLMELDAN